MLVQLDDSVERAGLMAARSSVAVAQDALDRTRQLFNSNIATTADLQAAQNKLDQAAGRPRADRGDACAEGDQGAV